MSLTLDESKKLSIIKEDPLKGFQLHGVQFEITSTCNFKCQFCPVSKQGKEYPMPDRKYVEDEMVEKVIDTASQFDLHYFTFSFIGDPMMHPKIYDYIRMARDKDLPLLLVSNGTLFHEKQYGKMNESGLQTIKISLQVADKETFGTIRGVKMKYENYLRKITRVIKARQENQIKPTIYLDVGFNPTLTPLNKMLGIYSGDKFIESNRSKLAKDLKEFLSYLTENGVSHPHQSLTEKDLVKMIKDYYGTVGYDLDERIFLEISDGIVISIKTFWDHFCEQNNHKTHRVVCKPNKLVIDIDGDVTVCNRDIEKKTVVANIYRQNMKDVLLHVKTEIDNVSRGEPTSEHCYYCKGCPTKRGTLLRKLFDRPFE